MFFILFVILIAVVGFDTKGIPLENLADNLGDFFTPRIIGGVEAPKNYAPYMIGLVVGYDMEIVICGGSLISSRCGLTAAHCIEVYMDAHGNLLDTFKGVVGSNDWTSGGLTVHFEDFHIHPEWDYQNLKNDIAILKIRDEVPMNKRINIIPLGSDHIDGQEDSYITGWGYIRPGLMVLIPNFLYLLNTTTISSKDCITKMKEVAAASGWSTPEINPILEICTLHSVNYGNCYGDSGSPLVSRKTNRLIGIVSWAIPCAAGAPDVYTRISAHINWVNKNIK